MRIVNNSLGATFIYFVGNTLDSVATAAIVSTAGKESEMNHLVHAVISEYGIAGLFTFKYAAIVPLFVFTVLTAMFNYRNINPFELKGAVKFNYNYAANIVGMMTLAAGSINALQLFLILFLV